VRLEILSTIVAVDRLLDMFHPTVNVFSDLCGTAIIARLEGEFLEGIREPVAEGDEWIKISIQSPVNQNLKLPGCHQFS